MQWPAMESGSSSYSFRTSATEVRRVASVTLTAEILGNVMGVSLRIRAQDCLRWVASGWYCLAREQASVLLTLWERIRYCSAASMALITSGASGFTMGSNRAITFPSLPTRNFVKFHLISPPVVG